MADGSGADEHDGALESPRPAYRGRRHAVQDDDDDDEAWFADQRRRYEEDERARRERDGLADSAGADDPASDPSASLVEDTDSESDDEPASASPSGWGWGGVLNPSSEAEVEPELPVPHDAEVEAATDGGDSSFAGETDADEADADQTDAGEPDADQSDAGQSDADEPDADEPDADQPDAGQSDADEAVEDIDPGETSTDLSEGETQVAGDDDQPSGNYEQPATGAADGPMTDPIPAPLAFAPAVGGIDDGVSPIDQTATEGPRRRHAADHHGLRLQPWMVAVAAVVVVGLLAWLIIGLSSGGDDDTNSASDSSSSSAAVSTTSEPTAVDPASLPQLLCIGSSYVTIETGRPETDLLADPAVFESQYPGSALSTIPAGCVAGSTAVDQVVLALGPFPTIEDACAAAKAIPGITYKAYAGSDTEGLTETPCP